MFVSRLWASVAALGTALLGLLAMYWRGRADAKRDAELATRRAEDRRRETGNAAAEAYRRDGGAKEQLQRGQF